MNHRRGRIYGDEDDEGYNYDDEEDYDEDDDDGGYGMHGRRAGTAAAAAESSRCACCQLMGKNSRCGKAAINQVLLQTNFLAEADSVQVPTMRKQESLVTRLKNCPLFTKTSSLCNCS